MSTDWLVEIGVFHYDYGVYFNNKYVVNGKCDWAFEDDQEYYACVKNIDEETVEILSYVMKT